MFVTLQVARIFMRIELFSPGYCLERARCINTRTVRSFVFNILYVLVENIFSIYLIIFINTASIESQKRVNYSNITVIEK